MSAVNETATLKEMIDAVIKLRNEVPEFNPNDPDCKEKIDQYHQQIHSLIALVQYTLGFDSYESTLEFIDNEISIVAQLS